MHKFMQSPLALAMALIACGTSSAAERASDGVRLLAPAAQDLVATELVTNMAKRAADTSLDRSPVAVSWPLDAQKALDARPQAHVAQSREYWIDASETQMQNGVRLKLSAPGAVVRITPHAGNTAISPDDVQWRVGSRQLSKATAIRSIANADELHAAGMDVPQGSVVMKLGDAVRGSAQLAVPTARGAYLVHVFEPESPIVLSLAATRDSIAGGERLGFRAQLDGAALERIGGLISAPDGYSQDVDFVRQADGSYLASVTPDRAHAGGAGLWEMHAFGVTKGVDGVARDAKTAFAVSMPVARLDGHVGREPHTAKQAGLSLRIGVEASTASRYALSGVLYGTGSDGQMHPVAMAQSAAWLSPGHGNITLRYDAASLSLSSPWEVRDLRLVNQADFSLQERRERALLLP